MPKRHAALSCHPVTGQEQMRSSAGLPTLFRSHFGPGSCEKHVAEARRMGARVAILELPRIALDIDDPDDIEELGRIGRERCIQVVDQNDIVGVPQGGIICGD